LDLTFGGPAPQGRIAAYAAFEVQANEQAEGRLTAGVDGD
jgi:hypothetical protein